MKIYIKSKTRRKEEFQFFMHDFVEACVKNGFKPRKDLFPSYKFHIRALCRNILWELYKFLNRYCSWSIRRKKALIITANGVSIKDNSFPYFFNYEIVPMLWDVWPSTWERMYNALKALDVRTVFVTSCQVTDMINMETSIHAYWIPEGIRQSLYQRGKALVCRQYDIFEMGRRMPRYHEIVEELRLADKIKVVSPSNLNENGTLDDKIVAYTNEELYSLISNAKILLCFPQCDTNPARAGHIETLTLRYWEAMLSGCIMIGRAPKELIEVVGYNPVIEVDWKKPQQQLLGILTNINQYQLLVNHNYEVAKRYASWDSRMSLLFQFLLREGYEV